LQRANDELEVRVVNRTVELTTANTALGAEIAIRKTVEQALTQAKEELERRVQERTAELTKTNTVLLETNIELQQFVYASCHDLQTPLRAICSFAQLLKQDQQGKLDEKADGRIRLIVDGVKRLQALINDLLDYSKLESNGKRFAPTDMNAVFEDVVSFLSPTISEFGAVVTRDKLPTVLGDRRQLTQLLRNLIENGLKFHGADPPQVHVAAQRDDGAWRFSVRDNGIGIEPQYHDRIFEIFRRLHTLQEYPGTGIGLAMCKRVVTRHDGTIWLESEPGKGTTFFFTIPDRLGEKQ
jgi:light-regulated signal transduction histidine kinase (bacteriophytochrome)